MAYPLEGQFTMKVEHCCEKVVLAGEVVLERSLGDACLRGDDVDTDAPKALAIEEPVSSFPNASLGLVY